MNDKANTKVPLQNSTDSLCRPQKEVKPKIIRFANPRERFDAHPSRKNAIHAECYECVGRDNDSWWKTEIGNCQIIKCALWNYRPYQDRYKEEGWDE